MKKIFSLFAALALYAGLWAETVNYLCPVYNDPDDVTKGIQKWETKTADATEITNAPWDVTLGTAGNTTWYVVKGTNVTTNTLVCNGAVNIILADGAKLTAKGIGSYNAGIQVFGDGNSLTIYAQSTDPVTMGQLKATGGWHGAGIGGGDGSNITINGGTITATGGDSGAGIGGGSGSNFTINGGTVTATGGSKHARGIDGGTYGSSYLFVATNLVVKVGDSAEDVAVISNYGNLADYLMGDDYVAIEPLIATSYINEKGEAKTVDAIEVNPNQGYWGARNCTTWYVVKGTDVQLSEGAICVGDVRLILADGAKLTATGNDDDWTPGIQVSGNHTLTIYAQSTGDQMGQLKATGGEDGGAGIGGGDGSNITINGGVIEATGGYSGAGIGGGDGSNITINGGTVTATGGEYAAGIGGGASGSGSNITINGGVIEATGGEGAAGIGGGNYGSGSNITINGGVIEATGGEGAAGIGGGWLCSGSNITISGGTVTATGGSNGAGIGGGENGSGSNITISGGTVTATGGKYAAGIGSGWDSLYSGSDITISGGTVIANGGEGAAGIGNGWKTFYAAKKISVATSLVVKAGDSANPTDEIAKNRTATTDIASDLAGKQYAIVVPTTYTRDNLSNGKFGTICLAYAVDDLEGVGATFYKLNYFDGASALYLEPVTALAAGMPYIFEAKAESFTVTLTAAAPADAGNENGLYGTLAEVAMTSDASHSYAAISNNQVNIVENGKTVTVAANRAYIDMNEVATSEQPHSAPLRAMGVPRGQATNNENVNADGNMNGKFIINGQFVIVKDGKMINALGF